MGPRRLTPPSPPKTIRLRSPLTSSRFRPRFASQRDGVVSTGRRVAAIARCGLAKRARKLWLSAGIVRRGKIRDLFHPGRCLRGVCPRWPPVRATVVPYAPTPAPSAHRQRFQSHAARRRRGPTNARDEARSSITICAARGGCRPPVHGGRTQTPTNKTRCRIDVDATQPFRSRVRAIGISTNVWSCAGARQAVAARALPGPYSTLSTRPGRLARADARMSYDSRAFGGARSHDRRPTLRSRLGMLHCYPSIGINPWPSLLASAARCSRRLHVLGHDDPRLLRIEIQIAL